MTGNGFLSSLSHGRSSSVTTSALGFSGMASNSIKLLTGNSHPELAKAVANRFVSFGVGERDHVPDLHRLLGWVSSSQKLWSCNIRTKRLV